MSGCRGCCYLSARTEAAIEVLNPVLVPVALTCGNEAANGSSGITISYRGRGAGPTTLGEQLKNKTIRLGAAGALTALLAGFAVPAHAASGAPCGPVVDSIKICTTPDGSLYPVLVNPAASGPRPAIGGALLVGNKLTAYDGTWDPADATLTHQWLRNDVPILGATGTTYRLTRADLGKGIRVKTTGTAPGYKATTVQSTKTAAVTNAGGAVPSVSPPATVTIETYGDYLDPNPIVDAYPGRWGARGVAFRYQWLRDGAPVPGATGRSFDLTGWGQAVLSVRITGYAAGYDPASVTSAGMAFSWTTATTPGAVVTGSAGLGSVLTGVDNVPWKGSYGQVLGSEHSYWWLRDGVAIPGATALTYTITAEDQGHTLVLRTNAGYEAYSNRVAVPAAGGVELKQLTNVTKPVLTGDAVTGTPMTATAGTWSEPAENLTVTYNWLSPDGKVSATGPTFTPDMTQLGATVTLLVTASAPGYTTARVKVTTPKPVTTPDPIQTKAPALRGILTVGMELYTYTGDWSFRDSEVKESRQWLRDGAPIAGATGRRYTLVGADFGKKISLRVTSTLDGRTLKIQTVDASAKVAAATMGPATPAIAGTAKVGRVLTVNPGNWTMGTAFKYRWLRNGVPISGATDRTYKIRTVDRDNKISVRVTGSRLGYTTATLTSGAYFAR